MVHLRILILGKEEHGPSQRCRRRFHARNEEVGARREQIHVTECASYRRGKSLGISCCNMIADLKFSKG